MGYKTMCIVKSNLWYIEVYWFAQKTSEWNEYACMHVCVCVYVVCNCIHTYVCMNDASMHVHVRACIYRERERKERDRVKGSHIRAILPPPLGNACKIFFITATERGEILTSSGARKQEYPITHRAAPTNKEWFIKHNAKVKKPQDIYTCIYPWCQSWA